jgi:hypothetical protein
MFCYPKQNMATVTTKLKPPPESAGGDGIGLSITVSTDQHDDETTTATTATTTMTPTYIPPSIPSPIPFEEEDDAEINNINSTPRSSTEAVQHHHQPIISSIMREQSRLEQQPPATVAKTAVAPDNSDQAHVVALEDRVRDLEEKLSTLSMLLLQQNQRQQLSPRNNNYYSNSNHHHHQNNNSNKSSSSSPDSSACDSSISPPTTPYRSLASFATIPSSNVPVLESPTPVSRRYRNTSSGDYSQNSDDHDRFCDFSLPYQQRQRSPRHFTSRNHGNNNNNNINISKISQSLRSNLSYQILHAPNNELDLRISSSSSINGGGSSLDTGSENDSALRSNSSSNINKTIGTNLSNDESFEHACRVPTLDSLPGSSRTSPIQSKDPIVAGVLSPDSLVNVKGGGSMGGSPHSSTTMPPAPFLGGGKGGDQQERDIKDATLKILGTSNSSGNINSNSATNDGSEQGTKHKKKKSNIKSKWLDYLNSVQESNYDTDKQMEGK